MRSATKLMAASITGLLMLCGCATVPPGHEQATAELRQATGLQAGDPAADGFVLPPGVELADGLSAAEAGALALMNNPEFKAQMAELGLSAADVVRAALLSNPSLAAVFGSTWEATLTFPFDLLWKRGPRSEVAKAAHAAKIQQVVQSGLDLVLDVRLAHIDAVLAGRQLELAQATVARTGRVGSIAEARLGAGDASGLEVASTSAEAAIALQEEARARLQRETAELVLRRLCRLDRSVWSGVLIPSSTAAPSVSDVDALILVARDKRADVRAAALTLEAAGASVGLARAEVFAFAAGFKATDNGDGTTVRPAVNASLPLFNRGQADVMAAEAGVLAATQRYRARLDQADLEIREMATRLEQAQVGLRSWAQEIVPALNATVSRSERAWRAGDIPYLAVLDATRRLIDAQMAEAEAAATVQRAAASLAHHMGGTATGRNEGATR